MFKDYFPEKKMITDIRLPETKSENDQLISIIAKSIETAKKKYRYD